MAVTGRVPPRDTLTGDPETRFSFDLCREMLAPETAGDGRSVNARRAPSRLPVALVGNSRRSPSDRQRDTNSPPGRSAIESDALRRRRGMYRLQFYEPGLREGGGDINGKMVNPDDKCVFPPGHRAESVSYLGGLPSISVFGSSRRSHTYPLTHGGVPVV